MPPNLSVIVPTYNKESTINRCLHSIKSSKFSNFELIVVDDGSTDKTKFIAQKYTDKYILLKNNKGLTNARKVGLKYSTSKIIVYIDSDIQINPDTLVSIYRLFSMNKSVSATTAMLSKFSFYKNFASQYKNLYMNFYFSKLPENVTFLYGSLFAVKKQVLQSIPFKENGFYAEDTEMGQTLIEKGHKIKLLKASPVIHIKKYSLFSLIDNDFHIAFNWARIFFQHKGWNQLFKEQTGFAHASKEQIVSLLISPLIILSLISNLYLQAIIFIIIWLAINASYFMFLQKNTGPYFMLRSIAFTFIDHLTMSAGVFTGSLHYHLFIIRTHYLYNKP